MLKPRCAFTLILPVLVFTGFAAADQLDLPHVRVTTASSTQPGQPACTVDAAHLRALAATVFAARDAYLSLGFDMPETIHLSVRCGGGPANLFNDGNDQLFLSIPSPAALEPPAQSKVFNLYGLCHELGHIAMYRPLRDRDWMVDDAAEGWAHYIGSVVVDRVFEARGPSLWPEPYDYRSDGTARLEKDIASKSPSGVALAAEQWQNLGTIIGLRGFPSLFVAWQAASTASSRPWDSLLAVLEHVQPKHQAALDAWWKTAAPLLLDVSPLTGDPISAASLSTPVTLPPAAGAETSHMSIGGMGEGRKFAVPAAGEWYITGVSVFGSRYGPDAPPDLSFDIVLSDADGKLICLWRGRYASFANGNDAWVHLDVPPARVPPAFYITLDFHATYDNGVMVGFDSATQGSSIQGRPGKAPQSFPQGDWLIRVDLAQKK